LVARTRVIQASRQFGFPPIVVRRDLAPDVRLRLLDTLIGMAEDPKGAALLERLDLDGFAQVAPSLYDAIRELARRSGAPFEETVADTL
jgi:phosphonate transport system substrate-binding protein